MNYRPDIDGLRAISVIAVIIFHSGFSFLSGGFVGVDIFFVISGYLITGLVYKEVTAGTFSYRNFYKRRIARLLPALLITLLLVLLFGFLFYNNREFDNLGKELFFSALGGANILFAQGTNYFAQDGSVKPLIHLWSLGVEEQFYLIWPTTLVLLAFLKLRQTLLIIIILFFISLFMAAASVEEEAIKTYFLPQYRAFELILGAFVALATTTTFYKKLIVTTAQYQKEIISYIGLLLIIAPMFFLNEKSTFPGYNTLYPIIGAALIIAFSEKTSISKILSLYPFVFIGLISYPLYLYHQPILSFISFFNLTSNKYIIIASVLLISISLAWLTYKYIEKPIRRSAHQKKTSLIFHQSALIISLVSIAIVGIFIAKNDGVGARFKLLNPFAYQITKHTEQSFFQHFEQGISISEDKKAQILFIGDSALQQYVYPFAQALNINNNNIDSITNGGCILLKGVDFKETFSDISCNTLRKKTYKLEKRYKYIVISQLWHLYDDQVLNFDKKHLRSFDKWTPFITNTINHFKPMTDNIILIGAHLKVEGINKLKPTIFSSRDTYISNLESLKVINSESLRKSVSYFDQFKSKEVTVIHPMELWSNTNGIFTLHNKEWSFFEDNIHASSASTPFLQKKLMMTKSIEKLISHNNLMTVKPVEKLSQND